jgi:hypothetical protein
MTPGGRWPKSCSHSHRGLHVEMLTARGRLSEIRINPLFAKPSSDCPLWNPDRIGDCRFAEAIELEIPHPIRDPADRGVVGRFTEQRGNGVQSAGRKGLVGFGAQDRFCELAGISALPTK